MKTALLAPFGALILFVVFVFFLAVEACREIYGRWKYGNDWEPGDGIGSPEDY